MKSFDAAILQAATGLPRVREALSRLGRWRQREGGLIDLLNGSLQSLRARRMIELRDADEIGQGFAPRRRIGKVEAEYALALRHIHQSHATIRLDCDYLLALHRQLLGLPGTSGWKERDNRVLHIGPHGQAEYRFEPPVPADQTPAAMRELIESLDRCWEAGQFDRLVLICAFIHDYLRIHPFTDGNGRSSRLLTVLLLYRAGLSIGRYTSLERLTERTKDRASDAALRSAKGWEQGRHDLGPWAIYYLEMLETAYTQFDRRVREIANFLL